MVKAVGVKFKHAGKVYYFDPAGKDVEVGDKVIVETAKGLEFATVVMGEEKIHPEKIVYISCNPATLVRDLKELEKTYKINSIQPLDMFPYSKHSPTSAGLCL